MGRDEPDTGHDEGRAGSGTPFGRCGQEAAAAFAPEDDPLLLEEVLLDAGVLLGVADEAGAGVVSAFFGADSAAPPDFSALTLPDRESLR
ncbi:hypothetical protein BJY16_001003 [Actinoplanes octamycinicus]|uniref:Uncharacterized protein n=1 Tax=Actinoplanes octamycinicus TaxID=135948 RepID=A0A7W7GSL8_9ACTN|nr:hypothetical protein [Actinoplanes octamycinicus]MBB4737544.1 hypothetical protein [Actinoplanes octamycinicus]